MKLIYTNIPVEPFECEDCGWCYGEKYTISLSVGEADIQIYECSHDGHMGGDETFYGNNTTVVGAMRDALLDLHTDMDSGGDYQRQSIIDAHYICEGMVLKMYSKWLQAKAFALALEDDGWNITYVGDEQ